MKAADIRERTREELEQMERELERKLWRARFDNHSNQLDDTSEIAKIRRDIARVKTILVEKSHAGASAEGTEA